MSKNKDNDTLPEGAQSIEEALGVEAPSKKKRKPKPTRKEIYKRLQENEDLVELRKDRLKSARRSAKNLKSIKEAAESDKPTYLQYDEETESLIEEAIEGKEVAFRANPGPQEEFLASTEDEVLFSGGRGPLVYGQKVLTQYGFKNIEDVSVGNWVVTPDNTLTQIIAEPFDGEDECYEIEFIDGRKSKVGQDHLWQVEISNRSLKKGSRREVLRTTKQLYDHYKKAIEPNLGKGKKDIKHIFLPLCEEVTIERTKSKPLTIDPYMLGVLIGDGCLTSGQVSFTTTDEEIASYISEIYEEGISNYNISYKFLKARKLIDKLRTLKLYNKKSGDKFIPWRYKEDSIETRKELLKGLMDIGGTVDSKGHISFCSISKQLAEDVQYIVRSLGGKATITTKDPFYYDKEGNKVAGQLAYIVSIQIENPESLFKLKRKKDRCKKTFNGGVIVPKLRVKSITPIGKHKCKCITLDDPRGLFLTDDFIVTHNSGKSFAMLMHPFQDFKNPNFRGLIVRNSMPQLRSLIRDAKQLYFKLIPGTKWKEKDSLFVFPSGATMEFGYCDSLDDAGRYVGQQYSWMGFDEITHFRTEEIFETITLSLRTSDPKLKTQVVCTTNPTGVGVRWVMDRWVKLAPPGKRITLTFIENEGEYNEHKYTVTRKWFNSNIDDNPFLDSKYKAKLKNIKDAKRRAQWLDGDWGAAIEGIAFPEWDKDVHTCEPFKIPRTWHKFRAMDWGYSSMGVCLWFAVDPENLILYVYREKVYQYMNALQVAEDIKNCQRFDNVQYGYLDASVWAKRGEAGDTPADTMMKQGLSWSPAQNDKGRRVKDKNLLHQYLEVDEYTNSPKLIIFDTCTELINELESLPTDSKNPEDVDTDAVDHAYDALRYGVQSNPLVVTSYDEMFNRIEYEKPVPVDLSIGY